MNAASNGFTPCKLNFYSIGAEDRCEPCPVGSFSKPQASNCEACPQYHKATGNILDPCECEPSFFKHESEGASSCTCKPGSMLMGKSCEVCESGRFKDWYGIESCKLCETVIKDSVTRWSESVSVAACVCPRKTFLSVDGKVCEQIMTGAEEGVEGMTLETITIGGFLEDEREVEGRSEVPR